MADDVNHIIKEIQMKNGDLAGKVFIAVEALSRIVGESHNGASIEDLRNISKAAIKRIGEGSRAAESIPSNSCEKCQCDSH